MNAPARRPMKSWLKILLVVAAVGSVGMPLLVRVFLLEAFQIPAASMVPTLLVGDHIFVDKTVKHPERGDVIVFQYPLSPDTDYVKRVVGLPGDTIVIVHNELMINGQPVPQRHLGEQDSRDGGLDAWEEQLGKHTFTVLRMPDRLTEFGPVQVPAGQYFVMGDNRHNSNDSLVWGTVPQKLIKGRVTVVWYSAPADGGEVRWNRFWHRVQ
jgi:signal peptidase I